MRFAFFRLSFRFLAGLLAAALAGPCVLAAEPVAVGGAQDEAPARLTRGLIVKLKGQDAVLAQPADPNAGEQGRRLGRVAALAGYPATMRWARTGRAMAHLRLPTPLKQNQLDRVLRRLMASGDVAWAEPNVMEQRQQASPVPNPGTTTLNDPYVASDQWWIEAPDPSRDPPLAGVPAMRAAWALHSGASSGQVVIAVIDTGVLPAPELAGRLLPGYDFVSETVYDRDGQAGRDNDATDPGDWLLESERTGPLFTDCKAQLKSSWHGTEVASILGAVPNNNNGFAGAHWHARILPVRVSGNCGAALSDIIDGMRWAGGLSVANAPANPNPAKVINISFGGGGACGNAYQDTINELRAAGVLVVASAGNTQASITRPANCGGVLSVTALNQTGLKASYASFGAGISVATTGGDSEASGVWGQKLGDKGILVASNAGDQAANPTGYGFYLGSGTSFAAPIAAGVAALMWEINPGLTVPQLIEGIKLSARPHVTSNYVAACSISNPGRCLCSTSTCGAGILDAQRALQYAQDPLNFVSTHMLATVSIDTQRVREAVALGQDAPSLVPAKKSGGGGGALEPFALVSLAVAVLAGLRMRHKMPNQRPPKSRQAI